MLKATGHFWKLHMYLPTTKPSCKNVDWKIAAIEKGKYTPED